MYYIMSTGEYQIGSNQKTGTYRFLIIIWRLSFYSFDLPLNTDIQLQSRDIPNLIFSKWAHY